MKTEHIKEKVCISSFGEMIKTIHDVAPEGWVFAEDLTMEFLKNFKAPPSYKQALVNQFNKDASGDRVARWNDFWKYKVGDICELNNGKLIIIRSICNHEDFTYCIKGQYLIIKGFFKPKIIIEGTGSWTKDGHYHMANELPQLNIKRVITCQE